MLVEQGARPTGTIDIFKEVAVAPELQTQEAGSGQPPRRTAIGNYDDGNGDIPPAFRFESSASQPRQPSRLKTEFEGPLYKDPENYKRGLRGFMQEAYEAGLMKPKGRLGRLRYDIVHLPVLGKHLYFLGPH